MCTGDFDGRQLLLQQLVWDLRATNNTDDRHDDGHCIVPPSGRVITFIFLFFGSVLDLKRISVTYKIFFEQNICLDICIHIFVCKHMLCEYTYKAGFELKS